MTLPSLSGRTAVVTGGASGIGLGLVERFLSEGMSVVVADIEKGALDAAVRELEGEVLAVPTDVSDPLAVEGLRDAALERFGAVHLLCNNAGVGGGTALTWEQPRDLWDWILDVNLGGVLNGVRAFLPLLLAQGEGHLVNTASMAGLVPGPRMGAYNVSKAAVVSLSETLHHELREIGSAVGVSVLCPGFVATNIVDWQRNRPASLGPAPGSDTPEHEARLSTARALIATGMPPAEVAARVVDAVVGGNLWVLPNTEMTPMVRRRADEIEAGRNPQHSPYL